MPTATVTIRELKNKDSGIDLNIPSHKETPVLLGTNVEYHVVVVSRLQCFKSTMHKESDVVQFMLPKTLENFEEMKRKILLKYPGTVFPPLPKKGFTVLGDSHAKERRLTLEKFLNFIAADANLVLCPATLEFLGVNSITASNFRPDKVVPSEDKADIFEEYARGNNRPSPQEDDLFANLDEDEQDLFVGFVDKKSAQDSSAETSPGRLFHSALTPEKPSATATQLFEAQDLGGAIMEDEKQLFLVPGSTDIDIHKALAIEEEDNSDLLNIEDDLDELLHISRNRWSSMDPAPRLHPEPGKEQINKLVSPTKPKISDKPKVPASQTNVPQYKLTVPGSKPIVPGSKPTVPGSKPTIPGPKPTLPGSKPTLPGSKPALPMKPKPSAKESGSPTGLSNSVIPSKPGHKPTLLPKPGQQDATQGEKGGKSVDYEDLFALETDQPAGQVIGTEDILKYIEDNSAAADDVDLFS